MWHALVGTQPAFDTGREPFELGIPVCTHRLNIGGVRGLFYDCAGDGARAQAVALARPWTAPEHRSSVWMQVARVSGDCRHTPLGKTDLRVLRTMPSLKWLFLTVGDARVAELAEVLPRVVVTNGDVCFRATRPLPPQQYYREVEVAKFSLGA